MNLSKAAKVSRVMNAVAAGTSDQNSSSVDMKGFDACQFVVAFGAITASAVTSVHVETSSDDSTFNDLEGTNVAVADDDGNQLVIVEVDCPQERYLRVVVDRGTQNAVIDGAIAFQHKADTEPVTHDTSTVLGSEYHLAPDEGTI